MKQRLETQPQRLTWLYEHNQAALKKSLLPQAFTGEL